MELSGANYLYTLATVSITFVGFSTLLLVVRGTIDGKMTKYDTYFTLSFMVAGFIVTAGGLLPQLLSLYGMPQASVWRASSAIMAGPILLFVVTTPARRRAATREPVPVYIRSLLFAQLLMGLYLLVNVVGQPSEPDVARYALAMTGMLFTTAIAFLTALGRALLGSSN